MNRERRKRIEALAAKIGELREELEAIRDEEQEYFDNMPESLQGGERGERAEAAVSTMDDAISSLEEASSGLEGVE